MMLGSAGMGMLGSVRFRLGKPGSPKPSEGNVGKWISGSAGMGIDGRLKFSDGNPGKPKPSDGSIGKWISGIAGIGIPGSENDRSGNEQRLIVTPEPARGTTMDTVASLDHRRTECLPLRRRRSSRCP
jgi:hypothetical protein